MRAVYASGSTRNVFGSFQNASGGSETVSDAPKDFPEPRKPFRELPKSFRMLRKAFRMLRKPFRTLRKPFRTLRKPFRMLRKPFRMLRKPFRTLRKPFRMLRKPFRMLRKSFRKLRKTFPTLRKPFGSSRRRFRSSGSLLEAPEGFLGAVGHAGRCPRRRRPGSPWPATRHRCDLGASLPQAETTSSHALRHPWRKPGQKEQPPRPAQRLLPRPSPRGGGGLGSGERRGAASIRTEGSRLRVGRSLAAPVHFSPCEKAPDQIRSKR